MKINSIMFGLKILLKLIQRNIHSMILKTRSTCGVSLYLQYGTIQLLMIHLSHIEPCVISNKHTHKHSQKSTVAVFIHFVENCLFSSLVFPPYLHVLPSTVSPFSILISLSLSASKSSSLVHNLRSVLGFCFSFAKPKIMSVHIFHGYYWPNWGVINVLYAWLVYSDESPLKINAALQFHYFAFCTA